MTEGLWFALILTAAVVLLGMIGTIEDICDNKGAWRR